MRHTMAAVVLLGLAGLGQADVPTKYTYSILEPVRKDGFDKGEAVYREAVLDILQGAGKEGWEYVSDGPNGIFVRKSHENPYWRFEYKTVKATPRAFTGTAEEQAVGAALVDGLERQGWQLVAAETTATPGRMLFKRNLPDRPGAPREAKKR